MKVYRLDSGLKILLLEDHNIPNVALYTYFHVGLRNERPGLTGVSHFIEHMMFNGTKKFGPGEFDRKMQFAGGSNAVLKKMLSSNIFAIRTSITNGWVFKANSLICSAATELNMTHDMFLIECRAFGARFYIIRNPGLTAGAIYCRPFGPHPALNV